MCGHKGFTFEAISQVMKKIIHTPDAPAPIGPYSQAVQIGNFLYTSGQIAINPANGELETRDIIQETTRVMQNLQAILQAAGFQFSDVVKTGIFLSDMNFFNRVNEVYASYFTGNFPARETVAVRTLPRNVNVEISMVAVKGELLY
jgi:2-iminobutanoate/2-iminopropanoate deaminase